MMSVENYLKYCAEYIPCGLNEWATIVRTREKLDEYNDIRFTCKEVLWVVNHLLF